MHPALKAPASCAAIVYSAQPTWVVLDYDFLISSYKNENDENGNDVSGHLL